MHLPDATGALADLESDGAGNAWAGRPGRNRQAKSKAEKAVERKQAVEEAFGACDMGEGVTVKEVADFMGVSEKTARARAAEHGGFWVKGGTIGRRKEGK